MTWARCIACGEMCGHHEQAEDEIERLHAENAAFKQAAEDANELGHELDWFKRLENKLTKHQWYYDYMEENPKPGAGT